MHVADLILGTTVTFTIAADRDDLTGLGEGCGDLLADEHTPCGGYGCWPAFPPGLDGTYQVYVEGSQGHVLWETL
jgi:hypothetical protein